VSRPRVAVVGSGLTALLAAQHLVDHAQVLLVTPRSAGRTDPLVVDGPLGLLAPVEDDALRIAAERCAALGLQDTPGWWQPDGPCRIWSDGRLRTVPPGLGTYAPVPLPVVAATRVLSPAGLATLAAAPLRPQRHVPGDRSVASLVDATLGVEVRDRLVAPWVLAASGGEAGELSAACELPDLWAARARGAVGSRGGPLHDEPGRRGVLMMPGGWRPVLEALRGSLAACHWEEPVDAIAADTHGPVLCSAGREEPVDAVVVTVPAAAAVRLLKDAFPGVARELLGISHRPVVEVLLDHEAGAVPSSVASGVLLVPARAGRRIAWVDRWPGDGVPVPPGTVRSRVLLAPPAAQALDRGDEPADVLLRHVDAELRRALGIRRPAVHTVSSSWSVPQRTVGHTARLDRLVHQLDQVPPGLHLGGPALRGVGPAARFHDAGRLAHEVRWQLSTLPRRPPVDDRPSSGPASRGST
jgi:protoporphyrinogen/coproporphyrinogen III oxidase